MQEVMTNVANAPMQARQALTRTQAVLRTYLFATERSALLAEFRYVENPPRERPSACSPPPFLLQPRADGL
jgi:hypothetical protein